MNKSFYLCIMLCCALSHISKAEIVSGDDCGDDCHWVLNTTTGEMTISGTSTMKDVRYGVDGSGWPVPWKQYLNDIKSVNIQEGIQSVMHGAFGGAKQLQIVNLPSSLLEIGNSSFSRTALTSVTIPPSVNLIYPNAFSTNTNLTDITFEGEMPPAGIGWIQNTSSDLVITYNGTENSKNQLMQNIAQGGKYTETCDENRNHCTYTSSAQEGVTLREIKNGAKIDYNDKGKIIRISGKKIYTVEEIMELTKNGTKFHVGLTYK